MTLIFLSPSPLPLSPSLSSPSSPPDTYEGGPHLYTETPPTVPLPPGGTHHFHCYILGAPPTATPPDTPLSIEVLKDGNSLFSGSPDIAKFPYKQVYVFEAGRYTCRLLREGDVVSELSVEVVPGIYIPVANSYTSVAPSRWHSLQVNSNVIHLQQQFSPYFA